MTGPRITRAELLAPVPRWTWLAKFWLCEGIARRTITAAEAKRAHRLSSEELNRWYGLYKSDGAGGLRKINKTRRHAA